jgi:DNA-binding transcriptional regulator YiaG
MGTGAFICANREFFSHQQGMNVPLARRWPPKIDVRAIGRATGMTQDEFAAAYQFSVRNVQQWERGAKRPSGPARTPSLTESLSLVVSFRTRC